MPIALILCCLLSCFTDPCQSANHYCVNGHTMSLRIGGSYLRDETLIPEIPDEPIVKRGSYRRCSWEITTEMDHQSSQIVLEGVNLKDADLSGSSNKTQVNISLNRIENVTLGMFQVKPLSQMKHIFVQINWDPKTQSRSPVNLRILTPLAGLCSLDMLSFNGSCHAVSKVPADVIRAVEFCSGDAILASFTSMDQINQFIAANEARQNEFPYQSPLNLSDWVRLGMFNIDGTILSVLRTQIGCQLKEVDKNLFQVSGLHGPCGSLKVNALGKAELQFGNCDQQMKALLKKPPIKPPVVLNTQYFVIKAAAWHHGSSLICEVADKPETRVIETLGIHLEPESTQLTVPSVWVSGSNVTVEFTTNAAYPEPLHRCFINSSGSTWAMTKISQNRKIFSSVRNLTVISVKTQLIVRVWPSMLNGVLHCAVSFGDSLSWKDEKLLDITDISAPCVTEVDLGSSRHWLEGEVREIKVTSRSCSIWSVTHTCWLAGSDGNHIAQLNKTKQGSFTSSHQLSLTSSMDQSDWSVRCRVNQSGVVYDDVVMGLPKKSDLILAISALALCLATLSLMGCAAACRRKRLQMMAHSDSKDVREYEMSMSSVHNADCCQHETDFTTLASNNSRFRQTSAAEAFVKVVVVLRRTNDADEQKTDDDEDEVFMQVAGHYEPDGCTFYQYGLGTTAGTHIADSTSYCSKSMAQQLL